MDLDVGVVAELEPILRGSALKARTIITRFTYPFTIIDHLGDDDPRR